MRKLAKLLLALSVCACCFHSSEARAQEDTINITSGFMNARGQLGAYTFSMSGGDFAASGYWEGSGLRIACIPCLVERRLKAMSSAYGYSNSGSGSAFLNGHSYSGITTNWSFNFFVAPVVMPNVTHDLDITTPFVMTGYYQAAERRLTPSGVAYDATFFTTKLSGRGEATHRFHYGGSLLNGQPYFVFVDVTYKFLPIATGKSGSTGKKGSTLRPSAVSTEKSVVSAPTAEKPQQ
jgi:hypothetical protein